MHVLFLEPYYGGSHRSFLDGWAERSRHQIRALTLPARKWKWRMRTSAWVFAERIARERIVPPDVLVASDMLNLAEFKGLVDRRVGTLPCVCYFHENQLTYPDRHAGERDHHFAFTNLVSGLAADAVWFNSRFHRDTFLEALAAFLKRMPDHQPLEAIESLSTKSAVWPQGLEPFPERGPRPPGPLSHRPPSPGPNVSKSTAQSPWAPCTQAEDQWAQKNFVTKPRAHDLLTWIREALSAYGLAPGPFI